MESFMSFDRFITPTVIKILYWIALVVVVIAGLVGLITGLVHLSLMEIVRGLVVIVLGPFAVRIQAELILLSFRIYETLVEIRDQKGAAPSTPPTA